MKISFLFPFFLLMSISIQAQLSIGIKGGGNYAYLENDGPGGAIGIDWKGLTTYYAGGFVMLDLNDRLSARGELLYSFEGAEFEDAILGRQTVNIDYLNLPILLRAKLISALYIEIGVEPGVIINKDNGGSNAMIDKSVEFGALAGVALRIGERLEVNARYIHGLTDLIESPFMDANGNPIGSGAGRARLWQIGAAIYIIK